MSRPIIVERFADNGEHSHWDLVAENGNIIWSGGEPETPKALSLEQVKDDYAREKGYENWGEFIDMDGIWYSDFCEGLATRYASAITEETNAKLKQAEADILELRNALIEVKEGIREGIGEWSAVELSQCPEMEASSKKVISEIEALLTKTQHYEK